MASELSRQEILYGHAKRAGYHESPDAISAGKRRSAKRRRTADRERLDRKSSATRAQRCSNFFEVNKFNLSAGSKENTDFESNKERSLPRISASASKPKCELPSRGCQEGRLKITAELDQRTMNQPLHLNAAAGNTLARTCTLRLSAQRVLGPNRAARPVELEATVDKAVATTGDTLRFEIRIDAQRAYLRIPGAGSQIMGLRILDSGLEREGGSRQWRDRVRQTHWYTLRGDLVGSYILPAMQLSYSDGAQNSWQVSTSEIFVEIQSVLPQDGSAQDIRGLSRLSGLSAPALA